MIHFKKGPRIWFIISANKKNELIALCHTNWTGSRETKIEKEYPLVGIERELPG